MLSPPYNQGPRTPSSSSPYRPHTSSPLSESCFSPSPSTSAAAKLYSRRLSQYKSIASTAPTTRTTIPTRRVSSTYRSRSDEPHVAIRLFSSSVGGGVPGEAENPHSTLLRDRLRQRCADRAQQARTKRVERERRRNALSSDGEDYGMGSDDDEDQEEVMLNDELFHRIMDSVRHKERHSYRLSFQTEVGSSLDPDMEDIAEWERNLQEDGLSPPSEYDEEEIAELAAQAEEDELWAELDGARTTFKTGDKPQTIPDEDVDMV